MADEPKKVVTINDGALVEMADQLAPVGYKDAELPPPFSEDEIAVWFTQKYRHEWRYVAAWGKWLHWDEVRWVEDNTLRVWDLLRHVIREMAASCGEQQARRATSLCKAATVAAVERLVRTDRTHAAVVEQWDADVLALNTPGGLMDLRTGKLGPPNADAYCTKVTAVEPDAQCPTTLWKQVLRRVTGNDAALIGFLQRWFGYCLTGSTEEHVLVFLYGTGANGKSVVLNTVAGILNDYAKTAATTVFTASPAAEGRHPTELAGLQGARLVNAIETEEGQRWAESKLKTLTGGDPISARFMRQDFFTYTPQFKLVFAGNHRPAINSVDEAMRRRMMLVPFTVTIPVSERDAKLAAKLRNEWPGILHWMVEGCLAWQQQGLNPPDAVRAATDEYLSAEDAIGRWLEEKCSLGSKYWTASRVLFTSWKEWCEATNEYIGSEKRFSQALQSHGFKPQRRPASKGFRGISLKGKGD